MEKAGVLINAGNNNIFVLRNQFNTTHSESEVFGVYVKKGAGGNGGDSR